MGTGRMDIIMVDMAMGRVGGGGTYLVRCLVRCQGLVGQVDRVVEREATEIRRGGGRRKEMAKRVSNSRPLTIVSAN